MTRLNWIVPPAKLTGFWYGFGAKIGAALATCLAASVLIAQAPPAASTFAAKVEEDPNTGYKRLVPLPAYQTKSAQSKLFKDKVAPVLSGQRPIAEGRNDLLNYYNLIYFPILTQSTDDALRLLSDERIRFNRDHLEQSGSKAPEAHATLNGLALNVLTNVVRDNFHPAVRYNAMLIVSGLNDQEATRTAAAIPMSRALTVILEEFKRPENSDAIRMAALLGLTWHLDGENAKPPTAQPAAWKAGVVDELIKFAETKEPQEGRSTDGHTWMRRRAVEALAIACQNKADAKVVAALEKLIRDDSEPLSLRTTVAMSLGKMSLQGLAIDVPALAKELGYVALLACDTELTRAITQRKDEAERMARLMGTYSGEMGGGFGGGEGGMPGGGMPYGGGSPYGSAGLDGGGGYPGATGGYAGPRPMAGTTGTLPGGTAGDGGYGTEMTPDPSLLDPKHYRFDLIRRKMRSDLYCVQMGLTGGEDHQRPKAGAAATGSKSAPKGDPAAQDKRGLFAIAKPNEKQLVQNVYYDVRDLVDMIENRATDTFQLDREMRKRMTKLENQVGKRTPAAAAGAADEDLPGAVSAVVPGKAGAAKAGAGAKAGGKAAPVKGPAKPNGKAPVPAVQQKAAWKAPPNYRPNSAFGSVRR